MQQKPGKIVCVARNYAAHAAELANEVPDSPVFFLKPASAILSLDQPIRWPKERGSCHYELELALRLGEESQITGVALALDLTLRDWQASLKARGLPWAMAKGFMGSLPLGPWLSPNEFTDLQNLQLTLNINGQTRQDDSTSLMLHPISTLIQAAQAAFGIEPGDILLTGTPKGVGPLAPGDELELILDRRFSYFAKVAL